MDLDDFGIFEKGNTIKSIYKLTNSLILKLPKNIDIDKIIDQLVSYYEEVHDYSNQSNE